LVPEVGERRDSGRAVEPQTHAEVVDVERIVLELGAAFNAKDPVALAALYTEDAVLMPPSEPSVHGNEAIRAWFANALPRLGVIRLRPSQTRVAGALAVQSGSFELQPGVSTSSAVVAAASVERAGKYVLVFNRAGGGWKICWDLWNLDQPPGEGSSPAAG
jgi:ketosteroid isomerase-like protein